MEISSSQCKDISYSKEKGKKTIDNVKKKDTGYEFINSDVPPTTCSLNELHCKSYRGISETDADSVEKFRISKALEIKANPGKDMSTQIPKKKPLQDGKKVIKPDAIIIHTGTNDLTNGVNTMKHVRSIAKIIEEMKGGGDIRVGFSGITERRDHDLGERIKDINERLKRFCNGKGFLFIDNSNIDERSLNKKLLHLSRYGNRLFSRNLINALKGF